VVSGQLLNFPLLYPTVTGIALMLARQATDNGQRTTNQID
jgi:hypothetical protein